VLTTTYVSVDLTYGESGLDPKIIVGLACGAKLVSPFVVLDGREAHMDGGETDRESCPGVEKCAQTCPISIVERKGE